MVFYKFERNLTSIKYLNLPTQSEGNIHMMLPEVIFSYFVKNIFHKNIIEHCVQLILHILQ